MQRPPDLNDLPLPALYARLCGGGPGSLVGRLLELARDEDLRDSLAPARHGRDGLSGGGDVTTRACIDPGRSGRGVVVMRSGGVVAGLAAIGELLRVFAPSCAFETAASDGDEVGAGAALGVLAGPLDEILETERTLLNLLGRMCGVATRTREFAREIPAGARAALYDTRKTTPGLRVLEKYAVRCGGGRCHRIGLHDAVLIKDNHLAGVSVDGIAAFVRQAAARARRDGAPAFVEVEVDTFTQFEALLALEPGVIDIVLLDNMESAEMTRAAQQRDRLMPSLLLEASGGVTPQTIGAIARTGVDRISVGSLTHGAVWADAAMDVEG